MKLRSCYCFTKKISLGSPTFMLSLPFLQKKMSNDSMELEPMLKVTKDRLEACFRGSPNMMSLLTKIEEIKLPSNEDFSYILNPPPLVSIDFESNSNPAVSKESEEKKNVFKISKKANIKYANPQPNKPQKTNISKVYMEIKKKVEQKSFENYAKIVSEPLLMPKMIHVLPGKIYQQRPNMKGKVISVVSPLSEKTERFQLSNL